MTPPVSSISMFPSNYDFAAKLRKQEQDWTNFINAAEAFLHGAYPDCPIYLVHQLAKTFRELMCSGTDEQIQSIEANRMKPADMMLMLDEQRDSITQQIEELEQAFQKIPDAMRDTVSVYEVTLLNPLRAQLKDIENRMSQVQADAEAK